MSNTPSIISAINKLRELLTKEEKVKCVWIVVFAITTSLLEVITASLIVVFAQALNQPEIGMMYLNKFGFANSLSNGRIVCYLAFCVGLIYLIKNLVAICEVYFQNVSIQNMSCSFKNKLMYRYAEAYYGFYLTSNFTLTNQVVSSDAEQMFSNGMVTIANIFSEGIIFVSLLCMVIYINPSLALIIFAIIGAISLVITKELLPKFYNFGQKLQEANFYNSRNLNQFFYAFKEIILLGKKKFFIDAYQYYSRKKSDVQAVQATLNSAPRMIIEILFIGIFVLTIAFLCFEHESPVEIVGVLGGYLYAGFRLMPGLNRIINQLNNFKSVIPSIDRVYHEYATVFNKASYISIPELKFEDKISLENICFKHLNTKKESLSNISLEIYKGECIGIIGTTGSGKSTLIDVILGLLQPYAGKIMLDNKYPVNSFQWHQKIGYVPQSVYLIDDTIEKNIAFGENNVDEEALKLAIDASQLRELIEALSEGVKTIVGERGIRLSGGERQRIAIARALYRNPEVLIFDEATSALDNKTEAKLMETIYSLSINRTVIMVAHRLTTLRKCNRIIVMDMGKIKEITNYNTVQNIEAIEMDNKILKHV